MLPACFLLSLCFCFCFFLLGLILVFHCSFQTTQKQGQLLSLVMQLDHKQHQTRDRSKYRCCKAGLINPIAKTSQRPYSKATHCHLGIEHLKTQLQKLQQEKQVSLTSPQQHGQMAMIIQQEAEETTKQNQQKPTCLQLLSPLWHQQEYQQLQNTSSNKKQLQHTHNQKQQQRYQQQELVQQQQGKCQLKKETGDNETGLIARLKNTTETQTQRRTTSTTMNVCVQDPQQRDIMSIAALLN